MEEQEYKYIAFISHKSSDEKTAKWLQERLASYKLPTTICKQNDIKSRKLKPCFRYQTDLGGAENLKKILHEKLAQSKYLIVICSPDAAKSEWVGDEVNYFIQNNLKDHIIPFVIKGSPYSADENECLHPILTNEFPKNNNGKKEEIACINLNDNSLGSKWMKRDRSVARVVAKLTGIEFSNLWDWQRPIIIRRRIIKTIITALLLLIGFAVYDFNKITYEYFADYADFNGIPQGITPLDSDTREKIGNLCGYYRFEFQRGKLIRVVHTNNYGHPKDHFHTEYIDRYAIQEIEDKREKNSTVIITYRNAANEIKCTTESFQNGQAANIINSNSTGKAQNSKGSTTSISTIYSNDNFDLNTFTNKTYSTIGRYLYFRENGYISKTLYKRYSGRDKEPGIDANGISGIEYKRDSLHRVTQIIYLDKEGQRTENNFGISSKRYEYDNLSQIIKVEYLNKNDELAKNELGWAAAEINFSKDRNTLTEYLFDSDYNRCMSLQGYSKQIIQHSQQSISTTYFDTNNDPCILWASNDLIGGFHKTTTSYDKNGRISLIKYFNKENRPCYNLYGEAMTKLTFDDNGQLTSRESCDINGKIKIMSMGCAKFTITYDYISPTSYNKTTTFLGTDNKPINTIQNYAIISEFYNNGNMLSRNYYDANHIACAPQLNYFAHELRLDYDDDKNPIEISFWDANLKPATTLLGFHKCVITWNLQGHCESMTCYSATINNPYDNSSTRQNYTIEKCSNIYGYCTLRNHYDSNGRLIRTEHFDKEDKFISNNQINATSVNFKYNENGHPIETSFRDSTENLCLSSAGYAILRQEYDKSFLISSKYFDENDNPFTPKSIGAHEIRYGYNDADMMNTQSAYDENGNPTINTVMGCHIYYTELNQQGQIIKEAWYDTDKCPINTSLGMASIKYIYNDHGKPLEVKAFNADGFPSISTRIGNAQDIGMGTAAISFEYDDEHRLIQTSFFDIYGNPMNNIHSGIARQQYTYTDHFHILQSFDKEGNPTNPQIGYNYEITLLNGKHIREKIMSSDTISHYEISDINNITQEYIDIKSSYKDMYIIRKRVGEPEHVFTEFFGVNKDDEIRHKARIKRIKHTIDSIDSIALRLKIRDGLLP